jgi:integrase
MDKVSKNHLHNRGGVWYYRRRVPADRVDAIGRKTIFLSLQTRDLKEARSLRDLQDVEWNARFEACDAVAPQLMVESSAAAAAANQPAVLSGMDRAQIVRMVQDYVARMDARMERRHEDHGPSDEQDRWDRVGDAMEELRILKNLDDPRCDELLSYGERQISVDKPSESSGDIFTTPAAFELLRRALIELGSRQLARLNDDRGQPFFDTLFSPSQHVATTFGNLAEQYLREDDEEAHTNGISQKTRDRTKAQVALIRSLVGDDVSVASISYDRCMELRRILAKVPTNWNKHYKGTTVHEAIERGQAEGRDTLGAITQDQNLAAFRRILDLGLRKGLLTSNPAAGIRPLKRDAVALADKRQPFTLDQLIQFFRSKTYLAGPYLSQPSDEHSRNGGWRFWLAPLMLFAGLRPNEICQALVSDVRQTPSGTWFIEVTDEPGEEGAPKRSVKTQSSRRRVPLHPQLLRMGFLEFVANRRSLTANMKLFETKPDKYGNAAAYPLKWLRDHYLNEAIDMEERQSVYSFRHSFRDALRRSGANPDVLEALGWSQGARVVSDHYGSRLDPDQLFPHIQNIDYPGLDLTHLEPAGLN